MTVWIDKAAAVHETIRFSRLPVNPAARSSRARRNIIDLGPIASAYRKQNLGSLGRVRKRAVSKTSAPLSSRRW
jgi:hypothetical protein